MRSCASMLTSFRFRLKMLRRTILIWVYSDRLSGEDHLLMSKFVTKIIDAMYLTD